METKRETIGIIGFIWVLYWAYIGIMENKMETTLADG